MRKSSTTKDTSTVEALTAEIEALRLENDALKRRVEKLNKLFFGPSSEKRPAPGARSGDAAQGHLFLAELMAEAQSTADRKGVCGSISATLPKDMAERLHLHAGDNVLAVETDAGILLTPYDPELEEAMGIRVIWLPGENHCRV